MDHILNVVATFAQSHPWLIIVVMALFGISEALPYLPNVEANSTVQMFVNILKLLKEKLSLKSTEPPAQ